MNTNQIYEDIQKLHDLIYKINKREPDAINELNRLYRIVFGETVVVGCGNCHIKAFRKLTDLTIEDLNIMENQDFKIKKGVLVEFPFRSGQFFSSALGVSNELAIEYLTAHPSKIEHFEVYPGSDSESKELDLSLISVSSDEVADENIDTDDITEESNIDETVEKNKSNHQETTAEATEIVENINKTNVKSLSRMNVSDLRAEYSKVTASVPKESWTRKELINEINAAVKND